MKFQTITYFEIQNFSCQNAQSNQQSRVMNYPHSRSQVLLLSNRATFYRKADKEAASSHHPHSISMHALLPLFSGEDCLVAQHQPVSRYALTITEPELQL